MVLVFEDETEEERFDKQAFETDVEVFGFFETLSLYKEKAFKVLRFAEREGLITREDGRLILVYYGVK
jgi:hypothetical protein